MKTLTILVDDELFDVLSERNYVPILRWRSLRGTICSSGEALANISRRDLDKKLPRHLPVSHPEPGGRATDAVLVAFGEEEDDDPERVELGKPLCKLSGTDGNVFSIIGKVSSTLRRAGFASRIPEFVNRAKSSGSYDEVLQLCHEFVEVE